MDPNHDTAAAAESLVADVLSGKISLRQCLLWIFEGNEEAFIRLMGHTMKLVESVDGEQVLEEEGIPDFNSEFGVPLSVFCKYIRHLVRKEGTEMLKAALPCSPPVKTNPGPFVSESGLRPQLDKQEWPDLQAQQPSRVANGVKSKKKRAVLTFVAAKGTSGNLGGNLMGNTESSDVGNLETAFASLMNNTRGPFDEKSTLSFKRSFAPILKTRGPPVARPASPTMPVAPSTFLTPIKLPKPPEARVTPTREPSHSIVSEQRGLLSPGGINDERMSPSPERDLLSPLHFGRTRGSPSPDRGLLSPVPTMIKSVSRLDETRLYSPRVFRFALLASAGALCGFVSDIAAELHFLVRLLTVDDITEFSAGVHKILTSLKEMKYFSGLCLWALRSITLNIGTTSLKRIGSNKTIIQQIGCFRDDIRTKLEDSGRHKPDSRVTFSSNKNMHDMIWNANPHGYKSNDFGQDGKVIFNNRKKMLDVFSSLLRSYENHTQGFLKDSATERGWRISFAHKCRDCLSKTMPCNYPWLALEFLKKLCEVESLDQRNEDLKTLEEKNFRVSKSSVAFLSHRFSNQTTSHFAQNAAPPTDAGYNGGDNSGSFGKGKGGKSKRGGGKFSRASDRSATTFGYNSNDPDKDQVVAEGLFSKSQHFFLYFLQYCDSHRFSAHIRIIATAKIKELSEPENSNDLLKGFDQRVLQSKVLARFLGFLVNSVFWPAGLDHAFTKHEATEALMSSVDTLVSFLNGTEAVVDLVSQLKQAWTHGRLVATVPWVVEYLRTLKFDVVSRNSALIKQVCHILVHIRTFALRHINSPPSILILTCIDKLSLYLQWEDLASKSTHRDSEIPGFHKTDYGLCSPSGTLLDIEENLIDEAMLAKVCEDFEMIALLLKKDSTSPSTVSRKTEIAGVGLSTPTLSRRRSNGPLKLTPTTLWEETAQQNMSFSFFKQHESLRELVDFVVNASVKNVIKLTKTLFLPHSVQQFANYNLTDALSKQKLVELDLVKRGMKYANRECETVIEPSLLALSPPEYYSVHMSVLNEHAENTKFPSPVLKTAIKLALQNAKIQLKQMLGNALVAEFRKNIEVIKKARPRKVGKCPRPRKNLNIRGGLLASVNRVDPLMTALIGSPSAQNVRQTFCNAMTSLLENLEEGEIEGDVYIRLQTLTSGKCMQVVSRLLWFYVKRGSIWTLDAPYRTDCLGLLLAFFRIVVQKTKTCHFSIGTHCGSTLIFLTSKTICCFIHETPGTPLLLECARASLLRLYFSLKSLGLIQRKNIELLRQRILFQKLQFAASAIHGGRSSRQMLHTTLLCDVFSDLEMLEVGEILGSK
jgi:hypothetical protein